MADPTIKYKKSLNGALGGILTDDDIRSGVAAEIIADVSEAQRAAGWDVPFKAFAKKETVNPFVSGWLIVSRLSEADDYLRIKEGTVDDTWYGASGYTDWKGSGELATAVSIGASGFVVDFENADGIADGDTIFVLDRTINQWEQFTLAAAGGVTWVGNQATLVTDGAVAAYNYPVKGKAYLVGTVAETYSLNGKYLTIRVDGQTNYTTTFTTETTAAEVAAAISLACSGYVTATAPGGYVRLERDLYYSHHYFQVTGGDAISDLGFATTVRRGSDGTVIGAAISLGTIAASATTPVVTSAAGTFNNSTYPLIADEAGGVDDDWTLTFTSASACSISGARSGLVFSGSITADIAPANWSGVYFTINYLAFGGTFAAGDKITWSTVSSSAGFWIRSIGAPGCARFDPNRSALKAIGSV